MLQLQCLICQGVPWLSLPVQNWNWSLLPLNVKLESSMPQTDEMLLCAF